MLKKGGGYKHYVKWLEKELNKVAWNDGEAKFEIRSWSKDHQRMGKGISFTEEELVTLANILAKMDCVKGKIVV